MMSLFVTRLPNVRSTTILLPLLWHSQHFCGRHTSLSFLVSLRSCPPHHSFQIMGPIKNIVVAIAMEQEAKPFVEHLGLKEATADIFPPHVPFQAFTGAHGEANVTVVTNGKDAVYQTGVDNCGTVPAALATFLALSKQPSDLLINAGTSGGFGRMGGQIGDVYLTSAVAHHDRRIPIPAFVPYGVGKLTSQLDVGKLAAALEFKTGTCTTGNSLDKTPEDDTHMLANEAAVKDMEAAAIAWSCALHSTPFLGMKVVTDIVDGDVPTQDEFLANLTAASKSLQSALPKLLDHVVGKILEEL